MQLELDAVDEHETVLCDQAGGRSEASGEQARDLTGRRQ